MAQQIDKDPENLNLKTVYKKYRNQLNKTIKIAKNQYLRDELNSAGQNNYKTWQIINNTLGRTKKQTEISELKLPSGDKLTDNKDIIDELNRHFSKIGETLANQQKQYCTCNKDSSTMHLRSIHDSIVLLPVSETELLDHISQLKNNKAPGIDQLSNQLIKHCKENLVKPLVHIFNSSFNSGVFPDILKKAVITPLFKEGCKSDVMNYRPISLLPVVAKLLEKCIECRLTSFFQKHSIFSKTQFGFQNNKSTDDAIYTLTKFITTNLDKNKKVIAVFLDLKKAFDTVDQNKLIEKLQCYGIRGKALDLLTDYITNRKQQVKLLNEFSYTATLSTGTQQGTVTSPKLFLAYINDLYFIPNFQGEVIGFADDTCLLFSSDTDSWEELKIKAEKQLSRVSKWLHTNLLFLNVKKTNFITFSISKKGQPKQLDKLKIHDCKCKKTNTELNCDCTVIERVTSTKYLGITIDRTLTWKTHIKNISNKIRKFIYYFRCLRDFCDVPLMKRIYHALVESIISYGIIGWGSANPTHLYAIEIAQKAVIKTILKKPRLYPTDQLFKDFPVLTVKQLFTKKVLLKYFYENKDYINHNANTRNKLNRQVRTLKCRTSLLQRHAVARAPVIFNKLPDSIKTDLYFKDYKKKIILWVNPPPADQKT